MTKSTQGGGAHPEKHVFSLDQQRVLGAYHDTLVALSRADFDSNRCRVYKPAPPSANQLQ